MESNTINVVLENRVCECCGLLLWLSKNKVKNIND